LISAPLDLGPFEQAVQLLDVTVVKPELRRGDRQLAVGQRAELQAASDQTLDLVEVRQLRYRYGSAGRRGGRPSCVTAMKDPSLW
jgi:hypothetical protein